MMYLADNYIQTFFADDGSKKVEVFLTNKTNIGIRKWKSEKAGKGWLFIEDVLYESTVPHQEVIDLAEDWILEK